MVFQPPDTPPRKLKRSGSISSTSSDRPSASIFVKPHPKLTDLPGFNAQHDYNYEPTVQIVVPVRKTRGGRARSKLDSKSLYTSPSLRDVPSSRFVTQSSSASASERSLNLVPFPGASSQLETESLLSFESTQSSGLTLEDAETGRKNKKKWGLFSRSTNLSIKKSKTNEEKDKDDSLTTSPPLKITKDSQSQGSKSVPSPSPQKTLPLYDLPSSQLHLSAEDLRKVNAYFAPPLDSVSSSQSTVEMTRSGRTPVTHGTRTPVPHLFAPGHLVDRGQFLEQLQLQRGVDPTTIHSTVRSKKKKRPGLRPLSLVPELFEGSSEEPTDSDIDDHDHDFEQDIYRNDRDNEESDPESYIYFTVDWDSEATATCYFIEDPFPGDVLVRYTDALTRFSDGFERDDCGVPFDV